MKSSQPAAKTRMGRYPKLLPVSRNDPERFSRVLAVQQRFQFIDFLLGLFDFIAKLAEVEPGELTVIQTVAFYASLLYAVYRLSSRCVWNSSRFLMVVVFISHTSPVVQ